MLIDTDHFVTKRIDLQNPLTPEKTALIIIDMMNRFCDTGWLARGNEAQAQWFEGELENIVPTLQLTLEAFRASNAMVVHVVNARWTHSGREVVPYQRGRDYDLFDTEAMSVIESLAPRPGEIVIRKVASSAFTGTGLEFLLRNAGIENIVLGGQYGSACVFYSLIQSRELGFNNYWLEDGILYTSQTYKHLFSALIGSQWAGLASAEEIVRALGLPA